MNPFQVVMIFSASTLIIVTGILLIIRTMPSKPGIGWWVCSSFLQSFAYLLALIFFGEKPTVEGQVIFFSLQLVSNQALSIGILRFVDTPIHTRSRMVFLAMVVIVMGTLLIFNQTLVAELLVVGYIAFGFFQAVVAIYTYKKAGILLNIASCFCLGIGLHWLDYPILGKLEWFIPIGFFIGVVLGLGLYFVLATIAMLQFKEITNDSEKKAIFAATHDPLTGVYNRSYLDTLFNKFKTIAETSKGTFILLYIDLDGFKAVNDSFGHKSGDVILVAITKRLKNWLGSKGDVVRIGGDEIVVLNSLRSDIPNDIVYGTSAAQSILKLIEEPVVDGTNRHAVSASIGGCYFGSEFDNLDKMLSRSDSLMYSAKQAGKRRVHFEDVPDERPVKERLLDTKNKDIEKPILSLVTDKTST